MSDAACITRDDTSIQKGSKRGRNFFTLLTRVNGKIECAKEKKPPPLLSSRRRHPPPVAFQFVFHNGDEEEKIFLFTSRSLKEEEDRGRGKIPG